MPFSISDSLACKAANRRSTAAILLLMSACTLAIMFEISASVNVRGGSGGGSGLRCHSVTSERNFVSLCTGHGESGFAFFKVHRHAASPCHGVEPRDGGR